MKILNKKNNRGVSLAEMLIVVAVLVILMAVSIPSVITIQKNLRQKELDAKAETIYVAVQNKLSKMKAGGNNSIYQMTDGSNGVSKLANIPGDADADVDNIQAGDICYFTSDTLRSTGTAASVIMDQKTLDENLLNNHWVIEYNPKSAVVYAVFYSEDRADCAQGYVSEFDKYDLSLRFKINRLEDGARVGYYGGGSVAASSTVSTLTPVLTITNAEKLTADISCTLPVTVSDYPVFKLELEDTAGNKYTKYYAFWACSSEYLMKIKDEAGSCELDISPASMQRSGRTFTLSLTLDDLSSQETRFVTQYGINSAHTVKLQSGTPLKVTVTAMCPGNYKITQNLSDSKVTNSLFADTNSKDPSSSEKEPKLNAQYGDESNPAVIHYARHLQNLDQSSGVAESVKYAQQSSDITFAENAGQSEIDDWHETYSGGFFNGITNGEPNFKPITNEKLLSYDGMQGTTSYRIMNLIENTASDAGLFAELRDGQILKNVVLTGTNVTSTGNIAAAGALAGRISGNAQIDHCQVFLTSSDINGKSNRNVWISGKTAGGLIGVVSSGTLTITKSAASTVVGAHSFDAKTSIITSFQADSVGGLIGSVSSGAAVSLTECYSDSYLVGKTVGGLVGKNTGNVKMNSCYAAGFTTYETEGAGLVYGSASMTNSYTVLYRQDLHSTSLPYYATAISGSASGKVYYAAETSNVTGIIPGESVGTLTITEMASSLGTAFKTDTADSVPYNLMGQTLSTYTYPALKSVTHYGDWKADFQVGALVYYEKYNDGTYGFYGANVDSTLKNDPNLTVLGDGYGVVYMKGGANLPATVSVKVTNGVTTVGEENLSVSGGDSYLVKDVNGNEFSIYPLSKGLVNTDQASSKYYLKAEIQPENAIKPDYYYFNPHFAKTVIYLTDSDAAEPVLTADSNISIRTARHLYMMSLYYDAYTAVSAPCTFLQERNIAYQSYDWVGYSLRASKSSTQSPIAGGATAFQAVYDGQCNWITDVSFTTDTGLYVGFIGRNAGTIRNVVLRASYKEGSDTNYYVGRSGDIENNQTVYMGVLAGRNEDTGRISNCAVAGYYIAGSDGTIHAYQNSYLYAGGLVGANAGTITSSAADTPTLRLSSTYANVYLGGFVGNNSSIISNCYALGHIEVAFAKGGNVSIAGFAGRNSAVIRNSYCATALTASGDTTTAYGFAPAGGSVSSSKYLNNGTYSYVNHMHSFNFDKGSGESALFSQMKVAEGSTQAAKNSYDFNNTQTNSKHYPFRAVVADASGKLVHYGDWLDDENMGTVGIFYWEHETQGSNNGYHFTYLGTADGESVGGTSLCNAHDDGGVISEYGYGYFELNQGSVTELKLDGATINGSSSFKSSDSTQYNAVASKALEEQMNLTLADGTQAQYHFYAFTTRTGGEAAAAIGESDNGNYLCLSGNDANSKWTLTYELATGGSTETKTYTYTVSPFFANAMSADGAKTITASDGTGTNYAQTPGTEENQYEVRSIQQLQYINWNTVKENAHTVISSSDSSNSRKYDQVTTADYPYLVFVKGNVQSASAYNAYWCQSHDIGNQDFSFTPVGCLYDNKDGSERDVAGYIAYFGGCYLGNAYRIKNINISSTATCVGLFGITVSAKLEGIVLYSDRNNTIAVTGGENWYNLGGLVGYAAKGSSANASTLAVIKNCTVSGYRIIDFRSEQGGWGGGNIGGLIGASNTDIENCSAVNSIEENCTFGGEYQNVRVGGLVGALRATVQNCYAGGSVSRNISDNSDGYANIWIGGLTGGIVMKDGGNLDTLVGSVEGIAYVKDSYSYVQLPSSGGQIKSVLSIASNGEMQSGRFGGVTEPNIYIINSYCYAPAVTGSYDYNNQKSSYQNQVDIGESGPGRAYLSNNGKSPYLTYDEMDINSTNSKLFGYLNGTNNSGTNRLDYGAGYSNVTVTEGSSNVAIDGKYSYPGSNAALEGKNYPFPAILQQKDLTFSTTSNPQYIYVHYGDWPVDGPYWENGRDSMDIFQDMESDGYAVKKFYLNPNNTILDTLTEESFTTDSSIAVVKDVNLLADGRYEVVLTAVNTGTTSVVLNGTTAEFTLEVTANIEITSVPEELMLMEGETGSLKFAASSVIDAEHGTAKNYEISEHASWSVVADNETLVTLEQNVAKKNEWSVKREDMGKTTLTITFTYQYSNPDTSKDPAIFTSVIYVDVLQPDTIGLSDGLRYNVDYLGAADKTGKDTSYSVDKPTVADADFFLYLDSEVENLEAMPIQKIFVDGKEAELKTEGEKKYYQTEDGYHLEMETVATRDEIYQYLSGEIYYLTTGESLDSMKNVTLEVFVQDGSDVYTLKIKLAEVDTHKALEITYEDGVGHSFVQSILSGVHLLPTQAAVIAVCTDFNIPYGKMIAGWKLKDSTEPVYAAGTDYEFLENTIFVAEFEDIKYIVTLDANGGKISFSGSMEDTCNFPIGGSGVVNLSQYSNKTARTGYELTGWKASETKTYGKYDNINATDLTGDITLTAQWEPKNYPVRLQATGVDLAPGSGPADQEVQLTFDSPLISAGSYQAPKRTGYKLSGWTTDEGVKVIDINEDGSLKLVPGVDGYTDASGNWIHDKEQGQQEVLKAQWEPGYQLKLYTSQAEYEEIFFIDAITAISGQYDESAVNGSTYGTFMGWYSKDGANYTPVIDQDGNVVDGGSITSSMDLYAGWKRSYYSRATSLENGKNYLIVSGTSGNNVYALKNDSSSVSSAAVTFNSSNEIVDFSDTGAIWTCNITSNGYYQFRNGTSSYLGTVASGWGRKPNISGTPVDWTATENTLYYSSAWWPINYYLYLLGTNFALNTSASSANIYFYQETSVTTYADSITAQSLSEETSEDPQMFSLREIEEDELDTSEIPVTEETVPEPEETLSEETLPEEEPSDSQDPSEDEQQVTIQDALLPDNRETILPEEEELPGDSFTEEP